MAIDPRKDVDGFTLKILENGIRNGYLPATPFGILTLLERYNIETKGRLCNYRKKFIVGSPMSILMGSKDLETLP
jgi:methylenetetrahydrofolate dehydrogenase (NADP+)/methenyltetrahydrofolate cyclohydrolase